MVFFIGLASPARAQADSQASGTQEPPSAVQGKSLYTGFCARCHGLNMVNSGTAFDLRTFPKDQRDRFERSVKEGLRAMPAWGSTLTPEELQSLWLYVSAHTGS